MFEDGIPTVQPDEDKRMKTFDVAELLELTVIGRPSSNGAAASEEKVAAALDTPMDPEAATGAPEASGDTAS